MRALFLSGLGKKKEADEQIKKTLFKNLTNFTCWHVAGMIYRTNKDYDGARRAYINALKYNPTGEGIMRDLANL